MTAELTVENYTDEDSFESFYKKNKRRIVNALKGKKMKRRHLRNARKLLNESVDLPAPVKEDILIGAIDDTVSEAVLEGYTGEDFDYLDFARKIRKRAEKQAKKPIEKLRFEKLRRVFRKKPKNQVPVTSSPNISSSENQISTSLKEVTDTLPLEEKKEMQQIKASIVQTNGQLSSPKITGVGDEAIAKEEKPEETAQISPGEQAALGQEAAASKDENIKTEKSKDDQGKEGGKQKPTSNRKGLFIGGGIVGAILLIILIIVLMKSSSNVTVTKV